MESNLRYDPGDMYCQSQAYVALLLTYIMTGPMNIHIITVTRMILTTSVTF